MDVNWTIYSSSYDTIYRNNPAYQNLVEVYEETFARLDLPATAKIADMGCGTGNFTLAIARALPAASLSAYDSNESMLEILGSKAEASGAQIRVGVCDLRDAPEPKGSLDAISFVHCLYVLGRDGAREALEKAHGMLRPNGLLVCADIGRPLEPMKFAKVGLRYMISKYSLFQFIKEALQMREIQRTSGQISKFQREGVYYTHDLADFTGLIEAAGFQVSEARDDLYLGATDFVVARKL